MQAVLYVMVAELHEPDGMLMASAIGRDTVTAAMHPIAGAFDAERMQLLSLDPGDVEGMRMLDVDDAAISPERRSELEQLFGPTGQWPAVQIDDGGLRARPLHPMTIPAGNA